MRRNKTTRFLIWSMIIFCLFFQGCQKKAKDSASSLPPVFHTPTILIPEAPKKEVIGNSPFIIDISNTSNGYITAISEDSASKINVQLTGPDGILYSYFVSPMETAVIPFTSGNGKYILSCYMQVQDNQYAALFSQMLEVTLENEFYPFLYPNQYVNFSPESKACSLALELLPDTASDVEILDAVYTYVTEHISYDYEKAEIVEAGYLPDIDEILETKTGICFDYASLITAMLRSRDVPCKLQIGYSGDIKHAWIDVYIRSKGWINKAIAFDGDTWGRLDPTFDSSTEDKDFINSYIGDASNYTVQFTR